MEEKGPTSGSVLEGLVGRWLNLKDRQVRAILYILILGLLGMWVIQFDRFLGAGRAPAEAPATPVSGRGASAEAGPASELREQESRLARDLEQILSTVSGAGRVRVQVSLEAGPEQVPALESRNNSRTIEERDPDGARRTTADRSEETRPVMAGTGGSSTPWVRRTEGPRVAGVLVVAEGARSAAVRYELQRAVETALGISPSRVVVMPMGAYPADGGGGT